MRLLSVLFTITITFIFSGCVASQSTQIANIDKINSFRDYVIQKRSNEVGNYDVVATTANKTLLELRVFNELTSTANATDVLKVLDDAKSYCKAKSGNIIYGDSAIATIENLPTAFSFDYIGYKNDMQKQGRGKFDGFLKCTNSSDGFEIEYMVDNVDLRRDDMIGGGYMQTYSRFFLINHQKSQSSNQKTWQNNSKYISYEKDKSIKEILSIENNTTPWRYEKAMGAYKYCTFNGGVYLVKNQITKNEPMNIDEYLIQRANAMNKSQIECQEKRKQGQGCYIMSHHTFTDNDTFYCKNQKYTELEFSLEHHNDSIFYKNSLEKF
ncbi:hypothetical protein [Aliarcobacter cryaerophilus]|uniref:hypothetical protein n=1 Tax=Aliarcobacter cryaerophilus TaxID=28198 RepID=UPI001654BB6C|nr:hypothetical protein [Aliarcobacter cryaerophilus]QNM88204.1 hypothetical protein HOO41_00370 [Aliarcobacter cryaerophilus]